ncbi:delta-adaptin [Tasmannia lanceolata]|uniref:delta-adaptin n=1 Tax=Tasmannia lanceolata TaxID=3420 RepID=UPI004062F178
MAASSIMESLFQRSLEDLIKSLRSQILSEPKFISKSLEEIKREIKSTDLNTKSIALQKLTYLHSLHNLDISFASFHTVELISSPRFSHKKIAYLAASLSFNSSTDILLLLPNQLRKDLNSPNQFEVSLALEFLSEISSPDLCRELTSEIFTLLSSTKNFVKKKAISVILRFFNQYPDSVRVCFKRLVENLDSSDPQVLCAVVSVFCELALCDPKSYLPLAPEFYKILVDSRNNWVLIKVIKIFAKLAPLEPRLAKRVVDPICEHMRRTGAKSLMFECVRTVVSSLSDYESAVKLAVEKIRELLMEDDPNLKYLGLQALSILKTNHLWAVVENKEVIIKALSDLDPNIKLEALHLVMGMVSETNVVEISRVLINYALKSDPEFCNEILGSILSTCGNNVYELIVDFDWYVSLLGEMVRNPHCRKGEEIERQLVDIGLRVKDVRPVLVQVARDLLIDPALLGNPFLYRILSAAAWVSGEYVEFSKNLIELMEALLQPCTNLLPPLVRAVYIQSAFKILVFCLHSYFLEREDIPSSSSVDLSMGVSNSVPERQELADFDRSECDVSANCEPDELSNSGLLTKSVDDDFRETEDGIVHQMAPLSSSSLSKKPFTYESITYLLHLIKVAMDPLSASDAVEVQERARNVLGMIHFLQEIPGCLIENQGSFEKQDPRALEVIKLTHEAFSEELGPVSVNAQERIHIPDGLILNENLSELETIFGDELSSSSTFPIGSHQYNEVADFTCFNLQSNEDSEPATESTTLLAQHRKRHELYYLTTKKDEKEFNDYPPANNDTQLSFNAADDLVKLTEQSLVSKKPNRVKPRPMVVKLDEGDETPISTVKSVNDSKDDLLSGAVRDILLGDESKPTSSQGDPSRKSSQRRVKELVLNGKAVSQSKENVDDAVKMRDGSPSSRKNRHHNRGKEKRRSPRKSEDKEENSQKNSKKSTHHHGKHKNRNRADGPLDVVPQAPVIQDFLL